MKAIDRDVSALKVIKDQVASISTMSARASADLERVMQKCESLENQSRRNNLLFFNLPDVCGETWAKSEESAIAFCKEMLTLLPAAIERAHRLGSFRENRASPRPLIVNSYKEKELILSRAFKLKGTR